MIILAAKWRESETLEANIVNLFIHKRGSISIKPFTNAVTEKE